MSPVNRKGNWFPDEEARADADVASAARTASGVGAEFDTDEADKFEASLSVTAASGTTPTLDVSLETTVNGVDWHTVATFPQKTAVDEDARPFGPLGDQCRWRWAIGGGTPSFTFSVAVVAED